MSLREFRSYQGTYINLGRRLQHGFSAFDNTQFFYASPYDLQAGFFREGAFATERVTGATLIAQYPLSKFSRLEFNAGVVRLRQRFENAFAEVAAQEAAAGQGQGYFLQNGSFAPITVSLVGETTRFREFGPWSGATYSLGFTYAPGFGDFLSQRTVELDAR